MDSLTRDGFNPADKYIYPLEHHYVLRKEITLGMDAKRFFLEVQEQSLEDVLSEPDLELGEIIEIDNGLQPYFFYYYSFCQVIPAPSFQKLKTKRHTDEEDH